MRKTNILEKPFTCAQCDNKFNDSRKMEELKKIQHDKKQYACAYCDGKSIFQEI